MSLVVEKKQSPLLNLLQEYSEYERTHLGVQMVARTHLETAEFPTRKSEDWKYTPVREIVKGNYVMPSSNGDVRIPEEISSLSDHFIVLENGQYRADLSTAENISGLRISPIGDASGDNSVFNTLCDPAKCDIFSLINSSYFTQGIDIQIEANMVIESPLHIIALLNQSEVIAQPRIAIHAGAGSKAMIFITFVAQGDSTFTNPVTEIVLKENASLSFDQLQNEGPQSTHINSTFVWQDEGSSFNTSVSTISGKLVRNNLYIDSDGENCSSNLSGVYMPRGTEHVDNHTTVQHLKPNSTSDELYKGIMSDNSTGVFNGRVYVDQLAQKTNAFQSNANILLSDDASINTKPELEIYADDVKCSHGTTTGQLNEEALFYLRSRGLSKLGAKKLLLSAMMSDVLDRITPDSLRAHIGSLIDEKLNQHT